MSAPAPSAPSSVPELLPMLARGQHRSPRRGACFMELASYLAGERWSDAPACTDPHLAALARLVNDLTSDAARPALAPWVPAVIGVRGLPPTFAGDLALLVASHALRDIAASHQHAVAAGVLRLLEDETATSYPARERVRAVLADTPQAVAWAERFLADMGTSRHSPAGGVIEVAVQALSRACVQDADARLRALLVDAVGLAREQAGMVQPAPRLRQRSWSGRVRASV